MYSGRLSVYDIRIPRWSNLEAYRSRLVNEVIFLNISDRGEDLIVRHRWKKYQVLVQAVLGETVRNQSMVVQETTNHHNGVIWDLSCLITDQAILLLFRETTKCLLTIVAI